MSLRKGETFNNGAANNIVTDLWDPLEARSGPARSTTCPRSLEDLLLGSGDRRVAELIARVDKAIETQSKLAIGNVLNEPEVLPVPELSADRPQPINKTLTRARHSHSSDSGIGSSIADSTECVADTCDTAIDDDDAETSSQSMSTISAASETRGLSKYACVQIHKHIVKPILREASLKEFHPIIKDVPKRIGNKEIKTLRDLEKSLIFLAPDYSLSPNSYLRFCERTIRVLHTTVTTLHETDQKAPTDRAYTQGYFCDLVEQIRRYATILAATRAKQAKGEELDEMDYTPDETVSLTGGVTHNGKPAELVRHKDGKAISIATGLPLAPEELASSSSLTKRHMDETVDDEVLRSMARRKKNAKPEIHECPMPDCDKEFKRPCDLTKHVKTHERPWKCSDRKCKYYDLGWPTEKERDRHVNDKHSSAPALYHCLYKPCPYTSKRESNCKQHMEKAHGWQYVRSKSNGKGKANSITRLPHGSVPPSPSSAMMTPLTPIAPSPSGYSSSRRGSMAPPPHPSTAGPSNWNNSPRFTIPSPDFSGHFNMGDFDFNNMADFPNFPITPAMSDDRRESETSSNNMFDDLSDAISPSELDFNTNFNFSDMDFFQPTPESANVGMSNPPSAHQSLDSAFPSSHGPLQSPADRNFIEEHMNIDQRYGDFGAPAGDFTLFGAHDGTMPPSSAGEMFPDMSVANNQPGWTNFGGQFNTNEAPSLNTGNSALEDLFPELKNN
ncbi:hypothetical protein K431DRAFT_283279 [Polychaeton citri CBS 116435]|uniref:C2H2-type domain-containing protein n=1 Tax=Polychaeton citri CBS 116435 TaxID=1314669 RepID=A0A9P4QEA8_9PEZI|nr:hypothetical protein K431DRAFT_283279 [Polychaeton citri CBS 116435]